MQVFKKARVTVTEDRRRCLKRVASEDSSSSEEEEGLEDARLRKRRMREKVAEKVSRALDKYSADLRGELLEARVAEAANQTVDALESEILPQLHLLESRSRSGGGADGPCVNAKEELAVSLSAKCEEVEATLQTTRVQLEEATKTKREALARAFHESQEKMQEKNEKERYQHLWLDAEKRAFAAESRVAFFLRTPCATHSAGPWVH